MYTEPFQLATEMYGRSSDPQLHVSIITIGSFFFKVIFHP